MALLCSRAPIVNRRLLTTSTSQLQRQFQNPQHQKIISITISFGSANQLASSADTLAQLLLLLCPILSTKMCFCDPQVFLRAEEHLIEVQTLTYFDMTKP